MARVHYWHYIVDEEGRPLENCDIRFYLQDNQTTEAKIFTHPSLGISTTTSSALIKTDGNGFFEFWIGDEFETNGYSASQKFYLTWSRAGIFQGGIENVDVFPPIYTVDQADNTSVTRNQKNKLVSNALAYKWDTHVDATTNDNPHEFDAVDTSKSDTVFNKLVSNSLINYLLSALASAGTLSIAATAAIERQFTITSWSASGDLYYANLNHFLGNEYPVVQLKNSVTKKQYIPARIVSVSENQTRVFVSDTGNTNVTIIG